MTRRSAIVREQNRSFREWWDADAEASRRKRIEMDNAATNTPAGLLAGFGLGILKQLLAELLAVGETKIEGTVARNLHKGGHDLPASATDQQKADFVRHATRQFFKATLQSGGIADIGRDFFAARVSPKVTPQLTAGTSTADGVHAVGTALVADVQGLVGA